MFHQSQVTYSPINVDKLVSNLVTGVFQTKSYKSFCNQYSLYIHYLVNISFKSLTNLH